MIGSPGLHKNVNKQNMSDEEEDYMSEKFLSGLTEVRPSLIHNRAKKRQVEVTKKQAENVKRQRELHKELSGQNAKEKLQESLKRPLDSDNKGFQLMARMGYKAGEALGKTAPDRKSGIVEPIGINIKCDRGGLGREAALRELAVKRIQLRKERLLKATGGSQMTAEEFRKRASEKAEERFVQGALIGSQKTCENLDTQNKVETPYLKWFWPERPKPEDPTKSDDSTDEEVEEEKEEESYTNSEKLEMLIKYLRTSYNFCYWCGIHYKDASDLDTNCPGLTRDDH